eukprot:TRINITY_DN136_c0_g1_i1.p1 TRINITY_DN136_c0_g1~~TRINITY_DN136_c0_g1_i1.p1  ORF type:complete len:205 (-),score=11.67 TRINITY_DN136_c0_g1_i1:517-1131(-)
MLGLQQNTPLKTRNLCNTFPNFRCSRNRRCGRRVTVQLSPFDDIFQQQREMVTEVDQYMDRMQQQIQEDLHTMEQQMKSIERRSQQFQQSEDAYRYNYEKREGTGSFQRYERLQIIQSGTPYYKYAVIQQQPAVASPMLALAVIIGSVYAAITTWFAVKFGETHFSENKKLQLLFMWPVLAVLSKEFRQQMRRALLGQGSNFAK